jgi:TPR repeat protein
MSLRNVALDDSVEKNGEHLTPPARLKRRADPEANLQLGIRFRWGVAVRKDEDVAWDYILRAAHAGHPVAFALCLYDGKQIAVDRERAAVLLRASAERGHAVGNNAHS